MLSIVDEFSNACFNQSAASQASLSNDSSLSQANRLKPIHERWRENVNRRDRGYYSKQPDESIMTDLVSSLLVPRIDINADLKLPSVLPDWFSVAIRLILSVGNNNEDVHFDQSMASSCPLLRAATTFIVDWLSSRSNGNRRKRPVMIDFPLPIEPPQDLSERSAFILERILVPLLPCQLVANKVYHCKHCKLTVSKISTLTSITVNVLRSGLHLQHELHSFFSPTISDVSCASCGKPYVRHIEVVQWPPVLIITVSDAQKNIKFRQPPTIISLNQFSHWLAISCPSSSVYDLVSFNSIVRSNANEVMVQVTKIKKSWVTSVNKRLIGDGEQLRRLFSHSRKFRCSIRTATGDASSLLFFLT